MGFFDDTFNRFRASLPQQYIPTQDLHNSIIEKNKELERRMYNSLFGIDTGFLSPYQREQNVLNAQRRSDSITNLYGVSSPEQDTIRLNYLNNVQKTLQRPEEISALERIKQLEEQQRYEKAYQYGKSIEKAFNEGADVYRLNKLREPENYVELPDESKNKSKFLTNILDKIEEDKKKRLEPHYPDNPFPLSEANQKKVDQEKEANDIFRNIERSSEGIQLYHYLKDYNEKEWDSQKDAAALNFIKNIEDLASDKTKKTKEEKEELEKNIQDYWSTISVEEKKRWLLDESLSPLLDDDSYNYIKEQDTDYVEKYGTTLINFLPEYKSATDKKKKASEQFYEQQDAVGRFLSQGQSILDQNLSEVGKMKEDNPLSLPVLTLAQAHLIGGKVALGIIQGLDSVFKKIGSYDASTDGKGFWSSVLGANPLTMSISMYNRSQREVLSQMTEDDIQEAIQQGLITQEQADAYRSKYDSEEEEVDEKIRSTVEDYKNQISKSLKLEFSNSSEDMKNFYEKEFNRLSAENSKIYNIETENKNPVLEMMGRDERIDHYAEYIALKDTFGEGAANQELAGIWQDHFGKHELMQDKIVKTGGQFLSTFVADAASMLAVLTNIPVSATNGDWTENLMNNPIMQWANALQETGCWTTEQQDKYKALGMNAMSVYKTREEENSFMSTKDFWDIIGQYGFTAATLCMSQLGSLGIRALAKGLDVKYAFSGRGALSRALFSPIKKSVRKTIIAGLKAGEGTEMYEKALETLVKLQQKGMYRANLGLSALLGTAEGGLESMSTYNTFLEENLQKIEQLKQSKQEYYQNASLEELISDAKAQGVYDQILDRNGNPNEALARQVLIQKTNTDQQYLEQRVHEDALDAASANFWMNSGINGAANVIFKSALMSQDANTAANMFMNKNNPLNNIAFIQGEGGTTMAVTRNLSKIPKWWNVVKSATKTSFGEFLEEYSQTLSDQASRAAMEKDLSDYVKVYANKEARDAFSSDLGGILQAGMNSVFTNAFKAENIKEGIIGFLSSFVGGFSPGHYIQHRQGYKKALEKVKASDGAFGKLKAISKTFWNNFSNLYTGGIREAKHQYENNYKSTQAIAEAFNAILQDPKKSKVLVGLWNAQEHAKMARIMLENQDVLGAQDERQSLLLACLDILRYTKGSAWHNAIQSNIQRMLELKNTIEEPSTFFDENGNFKTDLSEENGDFQTEEDKETYQMLASLITSAKNQDGQNTQKQDKSDLQLIEQVYNNAKEFSDLQTQVDEAERHIDSVFVNSDTADPITKMALIKAYITEKDSRKKLSAAVKAREERTQLRRENGELQTTPLSDDKELLELVAQYGSERKMQAGVQSIQTTIDQLKKSRKGADKQTKKSVDIFVQELQKKQKKLQEVLAKLEEQKKNGEVNLISDLFNYSSGDIAEMSVKARANVISNYNNLNSAQQQAVDEYIISMRKDQNNNSKMSKQEVKRRILEEAQLKSKSDTYTKNLEDILRNPGFLETAAQRMRAQYKNDYVNTVYDNEIKNDKKLSYAQIKQRVEDKVEQLRNTGQTETADLLESKFENDQKFSTVHKALKELDELIESDINVKNAADTNTQRKYVALKVIAETSGLSLSEIADLFNKYKRGDIEAGNKLKSFVLQRDNNNKVVLNQYAERELMDAIINDTSSEDNYRTTEELWSENEGTMNVLFQNISDLLEKWDKTKKRSAAKLDTSKSTINDKNTQQGTQQKTQQQPSSGPVTTGSQEDGLMRVKVTHSDRNQPEVHNFLQEHKASYNLSKVPNGTDVFFYHLPKVSNDAVFILIGAKKGQPGTFRVGNKYYQVIGFVSASTSAGLQQLINQQGRDYSYGGYLIKSKNGLKRFNKNGLLSTKISQTKDPKSITDAEAQLLNEIYLDDAAIRQYAEDLLEHGKTAPVLSSTTGETTDIIEDQNGLLVQTVRSKTGQGDATLWEMEIDGETVESILNSNLSDAEKIAKLQKNEFFQVFFQNWLEVLDFYSRQNSVNSSNLFQSLIGDYIYLYRISDLKPKYSEEVLTIEGKKEQIQIPTEETEESALNALKILCNNKNQFTFNYVGFNYNFLREHATGRYANAEVRQKQVKKLIGLIKAGLIKGYKVADFERDVKITNPFVERKQYGRTRRATEKADPEDTSKSDQEAQTHEDNIKEPVNQSTEIKKALQDSGKDISLEDSNDEFYKNKNTGENSARVTALETAYDNEESIYGEEFPEEKKELPSTKISQSLGNTIDNVIREAISILNDHDIASVDELYNLLKDSGPFNGSIPNFEEFMIKEFLEQIIEFKNYITNTLGWQIVPKGITLSCNRPVLDENGKDTGDKIRVAGTLDLLCIDSQGKPHIIDIKTKKSSSSEQVSVDESFDNWTIQVNSYADMTEQIIDENGLNSVSVDDNYIFVIRIPYNNDFDNGAYEFEKEDDMNFSIIDNTIEGKSTKVPTIVTGSPEIIMHDGKMLKAVPRLHSNGYRQNDLKNNSQAVVKNSTLDEETTTTDTNETAPPIAAKDNADIDKTDKDAIDGFDKNKFGERTVRHHRRRHSQRTERQRRFLSFVTNLVAPTGKVRLRRRLGLNKAHREDRQQFYRQELAKIFFNGNVVLLNMVIGNEIITDSNLMDVVDKLKQYYSSYIQNKSIYENNIKQRQQANKIIYDFLQEKITLRQCEIALADLGINARQIPELFDYITIVENNEKEGIRRKRRLQLLQRVQAQGLFAKEDRDHKLEALKQQMEFMQDKLAFLEDVACVQMLTQRLNTVQKAIKEEEVEQIYEEDDLENLNNFVMGKQNKVGAEAILRHIASSNQNAQYRKLARMLLHAIKANGLGIVAERMSDALEDIEGAQVGSTIYFTKTGLSQKDVFVRTALHEIVHAVIKADSYTRSQIETFMQQSMIDLQTITGLTEAEIRERYYGFRNVDEFISEFFTNFAFQESLKMVSYRGKTTFDNMLHSIKRYFGYTKPEYNDINKLLENILQQGNKLYEQEKTQKKSIKLSYNRKLYNHLTDNQKAYLNYLDITPDEYEDMTLAEQKHIEECCK